MITTDDNSTEDVKHSVARGAAWMVGMRWVIRAIGVVNMMILARLLMPEDFGLVAMAAVLVGILEAMAAFNVDAALLRDRAAGRPHYDSAWTLQVISGLVKAGVLVALAPVLAAYYGDPRVETVLYITALRPALDGFENIGQVNFRRDLQFDKEFRYWVYRRLLSFVLVIGLALWLRNYIALALAAPITGAVTVLMSYIMSPYRPRLATGRIGEIWAFSKWWILMSGLQAIGKKTEVLILGRVATPEVVGAYFVASNSSSLLIAEASAAVNRALMPNYARLTNDPRQLAHAFQLSLAGMATFSLPAGVGASLVAEELVLLLLGSQWNMAVPFFQWLALNAAFRAMTMGMMPFLIVARREKLVALCHAGYTSVLIPALIMAAYTADVETVAMTRTGMSLLFLVWMLAVLLALRVFTPIRMIDVFWRPVIATAVMAACVGLLLEMPAPPIVALAAYVAAGAVAFSATHVLLWFIVGRPNGVESAVLGLAAAYVGRIRRRRRSI